MQLRRNNRQRHHTRLPIFWVDLRVDPKTAEEDAYKMEHDISDQTFRYLRPCQSPFRDREESRQVRYLPAEKHSRNGCKSKPPSDALRQRAVFMICQEWNCAVSEIRGSNVVADAGNGHFGEPQRFGFGLLAAGSLNDHVQQVAAQLLLQRLVP